MVIAVTVHFLATTERLIPIGRVRTRDCYDDGKRVCVGFGAYGFDLSYSRDDATGPRLGLATVSQIIPKKRK